MNADVLEINSHVQEMDADVLEINSHVLEMNVDALEINSHVLKNSNFLKNKHLAYLTQRSK
jgi:hypothetical protein